jgi:hypothetical protein
MVRKVDIWCEGVDMSRSAYTPDGLVPGGRTPRWRVATGGRHLYVPSGGVGELYGRVSCDSGGRARYGYVSLHEGIG